MTKEETRVLLQLIDREMCQCALSYSAESSAAKPDPELLKMWKERWTTLNSVSQQLGGRDYGTILPWKARTPAT